VLALFPISWIRLALRNPRPMMSASNKMNPTISGVIARMNERLANCAVAGASEAAARDNGVRR
jgi:hypothetical protein